MKDRDLHLQSLKKGLLIDKYDLDEELVSQPSQYWKVSDLVAKAINLRDTQKNLIDETSSEIDASIRVQALESGEKLTETALKIRVDASPKLMKLRRAYLQLKLEADEYAALKEAYAQRAYVLKDLVSLFTSGYFQTSSVQGTQGSLSDATAEIVKKKQGELRRGKGG